MLAVPGPVRRFPFRGAPDRQPAGAARRRRLPGARSCRGCGPGSMPTRPTWSSRCSRPALPRSASSPARTRSMSHVVFCTDATPHRLWVHPQRRPVPGHLGVSRSRRCAGSSPSARVLVVPAPLRAAVLRPAGPARSARAARPSRARAVRAADERRLGARPGRRRPPRRWATPACTCWRSPGATPGWSAGCGRPRPASRACARSGTRPGLPS